MIEMKGIAFLFSETGTEGGWWAIQEDGFLADDGIHWKYEGLRELIEGDDFTVYSNKDDTILWHGIIHRDTKTGIIPRQVIKKGKIVNDKKWKQQVVCGMWVHWLQAGVDPDTWFNLFIGNKRCLLKREEKV